MIQLMSCHSCGGFLGLSLRTCPHCGIETDRARMALVGLASIAGGGAVSLTLMACYGGPCVSHTEPCYLPDAGDADVEPDADVDAGHGAARDDAQSDAADAAGD